MADSPRLIDRLQTTWHQRAIVLKTVSFGLVGIVNTAIDLSVFLLAYSVFALPLIPSNVLSWLVAMPCSYVMNSFITFARESGSKLRWRDYSIYAVSNITGVVANTTMLVVLSYWVPVLVAKLAAIGVSFLVNFTLSHFVVFHSRERSARGSDSVNP